MKRLTENQPGTIELRFPASAIDVNMELRDFPIGTYEVEPAGVRDEKVLVYPVDAPGADEEYELSIETFMQRINTAGEFVPDELSEPLATPQGVYGEVSIRRPNMRRGIPESIETQDPVILDIEEDVSIPGTDIILEAGDQIQVFSEAGGKNPDKNKRGMIEVYVEYDDEIGQEAVIGINSGFVYATPMDPESWVAQKDNFVLV